MNENYVVKAIFRLRPTAEFTFTEEDYSTIKWDKLEGEAPTQKEIDIAINEIKAEEIAQKAKLKSDKGILLERIGLTADEMNLLLS